MLAAPGDTGGVPNRPVQSRWGPCYFARRVVGSGDGIAGRDGRGPDLSGFPLSSLFRVIESVMPELVPV